MMKKILSFAWDSAKVIIIAMAIIVPLRLYVAQPFFVRGFSMEPTYSHGDYLVIDEISYRFRSPRRGEVVVFRYPQDPSQFFIKRIIGLPGEAVVGEQGNVFIERNGERFTLGEQYPKDAAHTGDFRIVAGPDEYVVLGDNRSASSDSRKWGVLPSDFLVGKVFVRVFPFQEFSVFAAPLY